MPVHYVTYEGIKFPPAYNSKHSLSFAHNEFLVRDDDIFNVTYPKSGMTGDSRAGQGWRGAGEGRGLWKHLQMLFRILFFSCGGEQECLGWCLLQWLCMGRAVPSLGGGTDSALRVLLTMDPDKVPCPASLLSLAGTVWMTEILSLIRSRGCPSWNRAVLNSDRMPWFSTRLGLESALSYPSLRLLTCHLPRHIFPKSFSLSSAKVGWASMQSFRGNTWEDYCPGSGEPWREGCWVRTLVLAEESSECRPCPQDGNIQK